MQHAKQDDDGGDAEGRYENTKPTRTVEINHAWRIGWNPFGSGLVLLVDRGVNCENHTHVVSHHTTNTPEFEDVEATVLFLKRELEEAIDGFVVFMRSWTRGHRSREAIAVIFYAELLEDVAKEAVRRMEDRWEKDRIRRQAKKK